MTSDVAHKQVCCVTGDVVCSYSGEAAAGMPDNCLLNSAAVDKIPALDRRSVDLDLQNAVGGEPQDRAVADNIDGVLQSHVGLSEGRAPENGVRYGQISRYRHGRAGRELVVVMQTKQEVDEVCVGILLVMQSEARKVGRNGRYRGAYVDICDSISIRVGAQCKNSYQENSKHKKCGKRGPAEPFRFYHAIKFSSFPLRMHTNTYTAMRYPCSIDYPSPSAGKQSALIHGSGRTAIN